jgi:predicted phage tail protein
MSYVDPLSFDDPPPVKHTLTTAKFDALNEPTATPTPAPTDVHQMLRDNLARENAAGMNVVKPVPPRRSRRKRDFWLMIVLGNLTIAALVLVTGGNLGAVLLGSAGIVGLSASLTWVMWFVMDDY